MGCGTASGNITNPKGKDDDTFYLPDNYNLYVQDKGSRNSNSKKAVSQTSTFKSVRVTKEDIKLMNKPTYRNKVKNESNKSFSILNEETKISKSKLEVSKPESYNVTFSGTVKPIKKDTELVVESFQVNRVPIKNPLVNGSTQYEIIEGNQEEIEVDPKISKESEVVFTPRETYEEPIREDDKSLEYNDPEDTIKRYKELKNKVPRDINKEIFAYQNIARQYPEYIFRKLKALRTKNSSIYSTESIEEAMHEISVQKSLTPLKWDEGLFKACSDHMDDLKNADMIHNKGTDGSTVYDRINRHGQYRKMCGENIQVGSDNAKGIVLSLIIDGKSTTKVHRRAVLEPKFSKGAVKSGRHSKFGIWTVLVYAE